MLSAILELAGAGLLIAAAFLVAVPLGLAVTGVALLVAAYALENVNRDHARDNPP